MCKWTPHAKEMSLFCIVGAYCDPGGLVETGGESPVSSIQHRGMDSAKCTWVRCCPSFGALRTAALLQLARTKPCFFCPVPFSSFK